MSALPGVIPVPICLVLISQLRDGLVCDLNAEPLELQNRRAWSDFIDFIHGKVPVFVGEPILIEFDLVQTYLSPL